MNKSLFFVLAATAMLSAACTKEDPAQPDPGPDGAKYLTVSAEGAVVKAAFGGKTATGYSVLWKAGDVLSVNGTASKPLAADVPAGTPAKFEIASNATAPYDVIYPAAAVNGNGMVTIPAVQTYSAGQFDPSAAIMTGHASDENVTMKFACAFVKANIARSKDEVINLLSLFSNGEETLSGTFQADCGTGALKYVSDASNGVVMTSAAYDGDGKIGAVFAIPAGTYQKGFSILATAADGSQIGKKVYAADGITLQAGCMHEIPEFTFASAPTKFSGGEGTAANPYLIGKAEDLVYLSELCNNAINNAEYHAAFFKQIGDIDMKGVEYTPICYAYDEATAFAGTYDGGNHKISGMTVNSTSDTGGLIGCAMGAAVRNLTMEDCIVEGASRLGCIAGAVAKGTAITNCNVVNCTVSSASKDQVGGIAGFAEESTISGCQAEGCTIKAESNYSAGAIVGWTKSKNVIDGCTATGCEVSALQCAGGIAGKALGGQISNCVVKGATKVTTTERSAGGICGGVSGKSEVTADNLVIDNCLVTDGTSVKSLYYSGGIAGYVYPGASLKFWIVNCGLENASVCTQKDDGTSHKGDCCIGGAVGWLRNSSGKSEVLLLNNYFYFADGGCKVDEEGIANLAVAGVVGYISNSATSLLEISGNCTDLASSDIVVAGKAYAGTDPGANKIGSVYGHCAHDQLTMSVTRNYWVNDTGIPSVGHSGLGNVEIAENEGFATSVFKDGSTVPAKLNAFCSEYKSEFEDKLGNVTLNSWTVKDNRPVLSSKF